MAEPLITDAMANWEPGPRCEGCGAPGTFQPGNRCWGCMNRHLDNQRALEAVEAARALVLMILTADHVPDATMKRLVRVTDHLDDAKRFIPSG